MKTGLKDAVLFLAVGDDLVAVGKDMFVFGSHLFKLLFSKFEVSFFLLAFLRLGRRTLLLYFREEFLQFRVRQRFDEHIEHPRRVHIGVARIGGQETGYEIFAFLLRHGNLKTCQTVLPYACRISTVLLYSRKERKR